MIYVLSALFLASPTFAAWVLTSRMPRRKKAWIIGILALVLLVTPILAMWLLGSGPGATFSD